MVPNYLCDMFYRRKIVLALLQVFGGSLEKINLQKLLFLVCQKQEKPDYEFIPYLFGCFSHSLKADLVTMVNKNFLTEDEPSYTKKDRKNYLTLEAKACADVRKKYIDDFAKTKDLHFFQGTSQQFHFVGHNPFMIIGTFHPKFPAAKKVEPQLKLF